ncbi:aminotransferase class I/II-fold pyridoxal phosphate-dependent enzyme [Brevibacterium aurantiacum]|uniref:aminotransferase class I/II-fold pyridoxal phosphate-dependent enzyme n=1 Tax=Brevibacterium aurantiacum TaxID=273384 RepID=UPI000050F8BE|nr:aminotransferase class I/II-fold pyridoxal phosphate-dependent enzyme [Brevibacterium aurantiacum]AZL10751.1 pyridoxal-5'-phosphate-dependent protein [Brevibacterium aurantiacum]
MNETIPLCVPSVGIAEEAAVSMALRSGWVAPAGPQVDAFEAELAELTERPAVVSVSSGTAALHLSLLAAGISAGDEVAVATLTFAATANAVAYIGATPVFIDCDESGLMSPELLRLALSERAAAGRPIRAVVPVDVYGRPVDHPAIAEAARDFGAIVVADAAESMGARLGGRPAGSFGDFAALSFNGNKIITTSSGGAVLCPDTDAAEYVRYLATQARQPVPHYEHTEIGYNYRLSNILAALGSAQLARLPEILRAKRSIYEAYRSMAERLDGVSVLDAAEGNCWMNALILDSEQDAAEMARNLAEVGIETRPVFKPMHLQPVHSGSDPSYITGRAEDLFRRGIVLPSSTDLSAEQIHRVTDAVTAACTSRSRV